MAGLIDMKFSAFVLYTYGGFHRSALSFVKQMGSAVDPATCLTSYTRWKQDLMERIAIAVQRGNADIMIQHSVRMRGKTWPRRRGARILPSQAAHSRSRGRIRRRRGSTTAGGLQGTQDARALARVARMIGLQLLDSTAPCLDHDHSLSDVDSDAETEPECANMPSSLPSIIPETPQSPEREVRSGEVVLVPCSLPTEAQGADAGSREGSINDARTGGRGAIIGAVAVVSMAAIMEDVTVGVAVHSVREVGGGGGCRVGAAGRAVVVS
jgi:hypothetical protein